jgi:hypothetical protein
VQRHLVLVAEPPGGHGFERQFIERAPKKIAFCSQKCFAGAFGAGFVLREV